MVFVVVALLLLPIVEIVVMIQVGSWLGAWETFLLLLMVTFLGVWIVTRQGVGAWSRVRRELAEGRVPGVAIVDGALILTAGVLFVIPGFVTDALAVALLVPPIRSLCRAGLGSRYKVVAALHTASASPHSRADDAYDVGSRVRPGERRPLSPPELDA